MNRTLKEQFGRKSECWEDKQEPVIRFWIDVGDCVGLPYFSLLDCRYLPHRQAAIFEFQAGNVVVQGPKCLDFFEAFCAHRATSLKADGTDIVSVTLILPPSAAVQHEAPLGENGSIVAG